MGKKRMTSIRIDGEIIDRAKEIGLNISKTCENALKDAIEALEQRKTKTTTNEGYTDARSASQQHRMVGRAGFEPATFCTSSRCPNRTRLPAHF